MIYAIIAAALILILIFYVIRTYNVFIKFQNSIEEAYATMDVYLKKRYDLIPNLVETVKGYAQHEKDTLTKVMEARNIAYGANDMQEKVNAENFLNQTLKSLFAVAENYPQLKADTGFLNLQKELSSLEGEIANSRKYYNAVVRDFNTKTGLFPSSIIAGMFRFEKRRMFETSEQERENVKVSF